MKPPFRCRHPDAHTEYTIHTCVKSGNFAQETDCGKNYDSGKSRKSRKAVPSDYVNSVSFSTVPPACGKPLWKTLWKVWKTLRYQQVFLLFAQRGPGAQIPLPVFITPEFSLQQACYVTAAFSGKFYEIFRKSCPHL